MGNKDGILEGMMSVGSNEIVEFKGGRFSFAHGDEIALILNDVDGFFILNCDADLFEEVKKEIKKKTKKELIAFWINKSKTYEISDWSADFVELE